MTRQLHVEHAFKEIAAVPFARFFVAGNARPHALQHIADEHGFEFFDRPLQPYLRLRIEGSLRFARWDGGYGLCRIHQIITSSALSAPERFSA